MLPGQRLIKSSIQYVPCIFLIKEVSQLINVSVFFETFLSPATFIQSVDIGEGNQTRNIGEHYATTILLLVLSLNWHCVDVNNSMQFCPMKPRIWIFGVFLLPQALPFCSFVAARTSHLQYIAYDCITLGSQARGMRTKSGDALAFVLLEALCRG